MVTTTTTARVMVKSQCGHVYGRSCCFVYLKGKSFRKPLLGLGLGSGVVSGVVSGVSGLGKLS